MSALSSINPLSFLTHAGGTTAAPGSAAPTWDFGYDDFSSRGGWDNGSAAGVLNNTLLDWYIDEYMPQTQQWAQANPDAWWDINSLSNAQSFRDVNTAYWGRDRGTERGSLGWKLNPENYWVDTEGNLIDPEGKQRIVDSGESQYLDYEMSLPWKAGDQIGIGLENGFERGPTLERKATEEEIFNHFFNPENNPNQFIDTNSVTGIANKDAFSNSKWGKDLVNIPQLQQYLDDPNYVQYNDDGSIKAVKASLAPYVMAEALGRKGYQLTRGGTDTAGGISGFIKQVLPVALSFIPVVGQSFAAIYGTGTGIKNKNPALAIGSAMMLPGDWVPSSVAGAPSWAGKVVPVGNVLTNAISSTLLGGIKNKPLNTALTKGIMQGGIAGLTGGNAGQGFLSGFGNSMIGSQVSNPLLATAAKGVFNTGIRGGDLNQLAKNPKFLIDLLRGGAQTLKV